MKNTWFQWFFLEASLPHKKKTKKKLPDTLSCARSDEDECICAAPHLRFPVRAHRAAVPDQSTSNGTTWAANLLPEHSSCRAVDRRQGRWCAGRDGWTTGRTSDFLHANYLRTLRRLWVMFKNADGANAASSRSAAGNKPCCCLWSAMFLCRVIFSFLLLHGLVSF